MRDKDESQISPDVRTHWDEAWEKAMPTYYWRLRAHYKAVEQYLHGKVLDVGCGPGYLAARVFPNEGWYTGVDISDKAVELGKMLFPAANFYQCDAEHEKLPFPDRSFDTVVCSEFIEHVERHDLVLKELVRVSREYIVLTVPTRMGGCGHIWPIWSYEDVIETFSPLGTILVVHVDLEHSFQLAWIRKQ